MRLIVLLFIMSFSATSVLASTVSYRFTAERGSGTPNDDIDGIVDALPVSGISGTLTFDLAVLDADSSSTLYAPPAVSIDGVDLSGVGSSPLGSFTTTTGLERINSFSLSAAPLTGTVEQFVIQATARATGTLGPDNTLPLPLVLSDFNEFRLLFSTVNYDDDGKQLAFENVAYDVTELAPVPLPATGLLLMAGLVELVSVRRIRTA